MRALRAAIAGPARFLRLHDSPGTVQSGKIADLVVLDADPLADIRNTTRIHAVVARGRMITAEERARMLTDVARAAEQHTSAPAVHHRPAAGCCHALATT